MRIIGGKFKGKKLKEFDGLDVRPTSDRARESVFNVISPRLLGCYFLDLCCGTGAVGLEALSRGAEFVEFVDSSKKSCQIAKFNINSVRLNNEPKTVDAITYLKQTAQKFDIVFFDPPYAFNGEEEVFKIIKQNGILKDGGVFIYEHKSDKETKSFEGFLVIDSRKYGIATFDFYEETV